MPAIISKVIPSSIAEDLELSAGDIILKINEKEPQDLIDYQFLTSFEEVSIHIKRNNSEEEIIDIEKDPNEDLGIVFESAVFNKIIPCTNRCVFCFVDQQPKGLRKSLYVKDDDYRLSYLQGTYVTLTNLTDSMKERIENLGLGPFYISVHSTNPELRAKLLNNPKAANIMNEMKWFEKLNIPVHTQIVLCPGLNDGKELERSLKDLGSLTNIASIAIVPLGLTKYREKGALNKVTKENAIEVIEMVFNFNKAKGQNLAFASDEFYILADELIPNSQFYNGFGQMEDGVGVSRLLMDDFEKEKLKLPEKINIPKSLTIATGKLGAHSLNPIIDELNKINNLTIDLIPITSYFWGEGVTVSGLVTGSDLIKNLSGKKIENLIIPSVMTRKLTDEFLDNLRVQDVENNLKTKIETIDDYYSISELLNIIKS